MSEEGRIDFKGEESGSHLRREKEKGKTVLRSSHCLLDGEKATRHRRKKDGRVIWVRRNRELVAPCPERGFIILKGHDR